MSERPIWTVEVVSTDEDGAITADARLSTGTCALTGWGRSRRNPADPNVPAIGQELAAARALADRSHQLVHEAADAVEGFEGHAVRLHE